MQLLHLISRGYAGGPLSRARDQVVHHAPVAQSVHRASYHPSTSCISSATQRQQPVDVSRGSVRLVLKGEVLGQVQRVAPQQRLRVQHEVRQVVCVVLLHLGET